MNGEMGRDDPDPGQRSVSPTVNEPETASIVIMTLACSHPSQSVSPMRSAMRGWALANAHQFELGAAGDEPGVPDLVAIDDLIGAASHRREIVAIDGVGQDDGVDG